MIAELATTALPLLLEPDEPPPNAVRWPGWRLGGVSSFELFTRAPEDDEQGALVQWAIVRYVTTETSRGTLAREYGMAERGLQGYLSGETWWPYGRPVLRALERLGIGTGRGRWARSAARPEEIVAASRLVMERAIAVLQGETQTSEEREELLADLRLLTAVRRFDMGRR